MDKAKLQELRDASEQRCIELFNQIENAKVELERTRGDFRTYENMIENWDKQVNEPKKDKV